MAMDILILEPFRTGSHAAWADGYARHSAHGVEVLGLEGRHWKWRMHGGAVTLAREFLAARFDPDVIVASDMLDLPTFLALTRERTAAVKTVVYFHENQLTYPWPERDPDPAVKRDAHYGFMNFTSACAADAAAFNSRYHRDSFLDELPGFLAAFPDHNEIEWVEKIRRKSSVLPLGLDLSALDRHRVERKPGGSPLILWNHRWEYDKNPEGFFRALFDLREKGIDFEVAVLGEEFSERPSVFPEAASRLGDRIVQFGFVRDFREYAAWLWKADILPVTSNHDFFGASVVQAIYCNCVPLLPRRLAYPEHIPPGHHGRFFYNDHEDLLRRLGELAGSIDRTRGIVTREFVSSYDWRHMAPVYDDYFRDLPGSS